MEKSSSYIYRPNIQTKSTTLMSTAQCAFINIVLFPLESHSHLKSRKSDCWPSRKAELDPDIICFSEFKTQVTLQAKVAQIWVFCPNLTHIWFSYDSLNSTNPFFFSNQALCGLNSDILTSSSAHAGQFRAVYGSYMRLMVVAFKLQCKQQRKTKSDFSKKSDLSVKTCSVN